MEYGKSIELSIKVILFVCTLNIRGEGRVPPHG